MQILRPSPARLRRASLSQGERELRERRGIPLLYSLLLLFSIPTPCIAQEVPSWEFFGGYSFQETNVREYFRSSPIIFSFQNHYAGLQGWDLSVTENLNRWFGGTLDISGHYASPELRGTKSRERMHTILYGPRFSFRKPWGIPFAHILMGAAHADVRVTPGPHASDLSFAVAAGGGADMNFRPNIRIRAFQLDYLHANALGGNRSHYRLSAGVVFTVGQTK